MLFPSTQCRARSPCLKESTRGEIDAADVRAKKPIRRTFPACWAPAASGLARAAPPTRPRNSRRFISTLDLASFRLVRAVSHEAREISLFDIRSGDGGNGSGKKDHELAAAHRDVVRLVHCGTPGSFQIDDQLELDRRLRRKPGPHSG